MPSKDSNDSDPSHLKDIPHERSEPRPDFSAPLPPSKLPSSIQETLDNDEKWWTTIYDGKAGESTDSSVRYAAYASRVRTILLSAHRYVAYTSDIGESFRPIAHPFLVRGAYAVSWAYLAGDVSYEGYKAYYKNQRILHPEKFATEKDANGDVKPANQQVLGGTTPAPTSTALVPGHVPAIEDYRAVMAQRAIFQSVASMGLPAFTIHSIVRYSGQAFKNSANKTLRTWAPIGLGIAAVPFLPYVFDKPVEHAVEWTFHKAFETIGGPEAVGKYAAPTEKKVQ